MVGQGTYHCSQLPPAAAHLDAHAMQSHDGCCEAPNARSLCKILQRVSFGTRLLKLRTGRRGGHDTIRVPAAARGAAGVHAPQLPGGPLQGAMVAAVSGARQAVLQKTGFYHCPSDPATWSLHRCSANLASTVQLFSRRDVTVWGLRVAPLGGGSLLHVINGYQLCAKLSTITRRLVKGGLTGMLTAGAG